MLLFDNVEYSGCTTALNDVERQKALRQVAHIVT